MTCTKFNTATAEVGDTKVVGNVTYQYKGNEIWEAITTPLKHSQLSEPNAAGAHDAIYSRNFKTVADLKSGIDATGQAIDMSLNVGSKVCWRGYYAESDGGGNWGIVKSGAHTDDGGSIFSLGANLYVEANFKGKKINVKKFGAKGNCTGTSPNGQDDTQSFKNAISKARGTSVSIYSPAGKYRISERLFFGPLNEEDTLVIPTQSYNICTGLIGEGKDSTYLIPDSGLNGDVVIDLTGLREKFLRDFTILTFDPNNCPAIGVLTARFWRPTVGGPTNNDWGEFKNITVDKYFSIAPYVAHGTEEIVNHQCKYRTDHNDAVAAYAEVSKLEYVWSNPIEAEETSLLFTTNDQSSLHRKHYDCDYYMGAATPTHPEPAMIWSKGQLMTKIQNPFFNNNSHKFDCARFERADIQAFIFGHDILGANYHQITKSAMKIVSANVNCSLTRSSRTTSFSDSQLIIEGYTNKFTATGLEQDVKLNNTIENSYIQSCRNLLFNEAYNIIDTFISVDQDVTQTNLANRVPGNRFTLNHDGVLRQISGFYSTKNDCVQQVSSNRTGIPCLQADTQLESFGDDLFKANFRTTSNTQFNYFNAVRNGVSEARIRRGGFFECLSSAGGLVLTSPNGTKYRIYIDDNGKILTQTI